MDTDMDLFELILFDVVISLIFLAFLLTSVFFTENNLFLILLSMAFGLLALPFTGTLGGWWSLLKTQERCKLNISLDKKITGWLCLDFGLKGNAWFFRIVSVIISLFALYNLVRYFTG